MANKFEKLVEAIINEDESRAKALFHQIVVEKSRDIYESLVEDDEEIGQDMGGEDLSDEISDHEDVIDGDEIGGAGDDMSGDEFGSDDMGGEASVEDRVMDLEDAIDELKAEFDELMGNDDGLGSDNLGDGDTDDFGGAADDISNDFGSDSNFDSDLDGEGMGTVELGDDADGEGEHKFGEASIYGESRNSRKSPSDLMREYVEKVTAVKPVEGDPIGSGGKKSPINKKSTAITGKNDMGGTAKNIAQGGYAADRDSNTGPKKPSNAYTKGEKKMGQDKYENSPAANTKGYKDKRTVNREQEGQTTDGNVPVVKKSFNPGGKPGLKDQQ